MAGRPPYDPLERFSGAFVVVNQISATVFALLIIIVTIARAIQLCQQRQRKKIVHFPTTLTSMSTLILSAITAVMNALNQYGGLVVSSNTYCGMFIRVLATSWGLSRIFLYWFLSYRTELAFESTFYGFSPTTLRALRFFLMFFVIPPLVAIWVVVPGVKSQILTGTCDVDLEQAFWFLLYAGGLDLIAGVVTSYMFASRMIEMQSQRHSEKKSMLIDPVFQAFRRHSVLGVISIASVVGGIVLLGFIRRIDGIVLSLTLMIQALCIFNMFSENTTLYRLLCSCCEGKEIVTMMADHKLNFVFSFRAEENQQLITLRTYKPSVTQSSELSSQTSVDPQDRVIPLQPERFPVPSRDMDDDLEEFDMDNTKFSLVFGNDSTSLTEKHVHKFMTGQGEDEDVTWVRSVPNQETNKRRMTLPKLERADTPTLIQFVQAMHSLGEHIVSESHKVDALEEDTEEIDYAPPTPRTRVARPPLPQPPPAPPKVPPNVLTATPSVSLNEAYSGGFPSERDLPSTRRIPSASPSLSPIAVRAPSALAGMNLQEDNAQNRLAAILRGSALTTGFTSITQNIKKPPPPPPKVYMVPLILDL